MTAQACARELVTVGGKALERLEYKGCPVVTMKQVDEVHGKSRDTALRCFNRNRKHFNEGADYFRTDCQEAKELFGVPAPNGVFLLTEPGYLMIAKSFTDDLAWKVQRQLVDNYFRRNKPTATAPVPANPMDVLKTMFAAMEAQQTDLERMKAEVSELKQEMRAIKSAPAKQIELEFQGKETLLKQDSGHRSMENPLYARFRKLYPNRTLTWFKKRHKIPLTLETLTRIIYRNGKCDPVTLTVTCSYLKFTQDEVKEAAKYFGIKDKLGVFSLYDTKGATRK